MAFANEAVGSLSKMKRELNTVALEGLRGLSGKYADRLTAVAEKTFGRGDLLGGTTISRPQILAYDGRNRLKVMAMPEGFGMYVRDMPTPEGTLVMFPLHTIGTTAEGQPIINPDTSGSYTIAHIPDGIRSNRYNPAEMKADLVFTVDADNLVTVDGQSPVAPQEYELFSAIVEEFERRALV